MDMMRFSATVIILVQVTVSFPCTSLTHLGSSSFILGPLHCMVHTVATCVFYKIFFSFKKCVVCMHTTHMQVSLETKRGLDLVL